jgi:hypothetical protein
MSVEKSRKELVPPLSEEKSEPDQCSNCERFLQPKIAPPDAVKAGFVLRGKCRRFPEPLAKDAWDWCAEYKRREENMERGGE